MILFSRVSIVHSRILQPLVTFTVVQCSCYQGFACAFPNSPTIRDAYYGTSTYIVHMYYELFVENELLFSPFSILTVFHNSLESQAKAVKFSQIFCVTFHPDKFSPEDTTWNPRPFQMVQRLLVQLSLAAGVITLTT